MFKLLFLLSLSLCLSVFSSVLTKKITKYDPFPNCTQQMNNNATLAKLAKCPQINYNVNFSNPTICCHFWEAMSCQKEVYLTISECKSARFLIEFFNDLVKPGTCTPVASCANVTTNEGVETVYENISPLMQLMENQTYSNCSSAIEKSLFTCMDPFEGLMDGPASQRDLCCDQLSFQVCAQNVIDKELNCAVARMQFDSAFKTIRDNIAKTSCPTGKFHCSKSGATSVPLTAPLFSLSLIIAFFYQKCLN